jgi:hypothetical protein
MPFVTSMGRPSTSSSILVSALATINNYSENKFLLLNCLISFIVDLMK